MATSPTSATAAVESAPNIQTALQAMAFSGTGPFVTAFKQKKIVITYRLVRTVKSGISKRAVASTLIRLRNPAVS